MAISMYTILIVDDEKLALEGVSYSVGASGIPFRWIMEAHSAEEALEIIRTNRPDILLTDIKMGEKSGLDLIREGKAIHPAMVSVIICGYPDFSFAQEALSLGACGYLLKPVKNEEVREILAKATAQVRKLRDEQDMSKDNYLYRLTLKEHRLHEAVNNFVTNGDQESLQQLREIIGEENRWYQIMILRMPPQELNHSVSGLEKKALLYGMHNIMDELLTPGGTRQGLVANSMEHENVLVGILFSVRSSARHAEETMHASALKIKKTLEETFEMHLSVSLSSVNEALSPSLYTEAVLAQDMRFSLPETARDGVLKYAAYKDNLSLASQPDKFQTLRKFLNGNDIGSATDLIRHMVLSFRGEAELGIRSLYTAIINAISVACYKNGNSILPLLGSERISGSILNTFEELDEIYANLLNIIVNNLQNDVHENESSGEIMMRIRQYIDDSFTDSELGTNKLSKEFSISLGYLSASYKKEHGITISKYIISKRIGYAEKLLRESRLSVSEIAQACGFNNLSYFMRLFKNSCGMTPSQYRAKVENGEMP